MRALRLSIAGSAVASWKPGSPQLRDEVSLGVSPGFCTFIIGLCTMLLRINNGEIFFFASCSMLFRLFVFCLFL
ncbi:hypothetical protein DW889_09675 [Bacteroides stercoris]|uniref:Uncharacterized protein n=1 Tax=Bacteroides stercoris TaxID=46506 RepID=A0A413V467_BACSE|nr:hypothetical protein DW889_09675 [Bacteroides stercoris]